MLGAGGGGGGGGQQRHALAQVYIMKSGPTSRFAAAFLQWLQSVLIMHAAHN